MGIAYNDMDSDVEIIANGKTYCGKLDCCRVDLDTIPNGYHVYSIRESDETGEPSTLEKSVWVNHYGDFVTPTAIAELESKEVKYLDIEAILI